MNWRNLLAASLVVWVNRVDFGQMYLVMKIKNRHTQDCPVVNNVVDWGYVKDVLQSSITHHAGVRFTMTLVLNKLK